MARPDHKTKIVATVGPASQSVEVLERMVTAGMSVARLNFSHGGADAHRQFIANLREAERRAGRAVTIMADLPGPKIRIGRVAPEPIELRAGDPVALTPDEVVGDEHRITVGYARLPQIAAPGTRISLNDGTIQLVVERVDGRDVSCRVVVGGALTSRKGVNIPGVDLGISAFTERDRQWLQFALEEGVEAVSQSFVEKGEDIGQVRAAARTFGRRPFVIAKIERSRALDNLEGILEAADGVMIARGDLGVEIPIEKMAVVQKRVVREANRLGRPVITATQMLESMVASRIPTRAEATDVANAILDGTDCVMLSAESATGAYPVEAVAMLGRIASVAEPLLEEQRSRASEGLPPARPPRPADLMCLGVEAMVQALEPRGVFVPTRSGTTARTLARFRLPVWVSAATDDPQTARDLAFSYGVEPIYEPTLPEDWNGYIRALLRQAGLQQGFALLVEGPSHLRPGANHRLELVDLDKG